MRATAEVLACAALTAAGVLVGAGGSRGLARRRLRDVTRPPVRAATGSGDVVVAGPSHAGRSGAPGRQTPGPAVRTRAAGTCAAVATVLLGLGAGAGPVCGVLAVGAATWLWGGRSARGVRRDEARVRADLPRAADLLAACLEAGAAPGEALSVVAEAVGGPLGGRLAAVCAVLRVGDTVEAWRGVEPGDPLAPVARAFVRAAATGAPLAEAVALVAEEQRLSRRWAAEAAARRAGVLAVAPLAVCFLPAFVLVGVAPMVVGTAVVVLGGLH